MPRPFTPKVLTANDLLKGDVVYFSADGDWRRAHDEARLFVDQEEAEAALATAAQDNSLVGPYLADATEATSGPEPVHFREAFRAKGPSNYTHGKQEA